MVGNHHKIYKNAFCLTYNRKVFANFLLGTRIFISENSL